MVVYPSVSLISGAVFVHHLFIWDGSSNVIMLCTRDLHDKHIYHLLVSLGQIPDHTVCCTDGLLRYLKRKLRAAYGVSKCDYPHLTGQPKNSQDVLCAPFLCLKRPATHLMKPQRVLSYCVLHPVTLTSSNVQGLYDSFTPHAQKMGFISVKNRRKKSTAPYPNFLLRMERTTYERQQMILHAAPNTPYINTGCVWGLVGWNCTDWWSGTAVCWKYRRK